MISRWRSESTSSSAALYLCLSAMHSLLCGSARQATFIACRNRSCSMMACSSCVRSGAQIAYWFSNSDCGQPYASGFVVHTSLAWLVATQTPCPLDTVPGPQGGGGGGGHFCPVHGFGGGEGQFLPTMHGLGAFASSGCRRRNKRANQWCGFVVGGCGLTFVAIGCSGLAFTFSEPRRWLPAVVELLRSAGDPEWLEFEDACREAWFGEPGEERAFEPPPAE